MEQQTAMEKLAEASLEHVLDEVRALREEIANLRAVGPEVVRPPR